ncbi:hypothetical protein BGZ88_004480 [Linnemannia elongata]|nr:hypothetical protein BGZ88_004480 [Linnemannia elongata]
MDQPMRGKQDRVHANRPPIGRSLSNGFQHHSFASWDRSNIGRPWAMYTAQQRARAQETVMVESQLSSIRSNDYVWVEDDNNDDNTTRHQDAQAVDKATGHQQDANHTLHLDPNREQYSTEMRAYMLIGAS